MGLKQWLKLISVPILLIALAFLIDSFLLWQVVLVACLVFIAGLLWVVLFWNGLSLQASRLPESCQAGDVLEQDVSILSRSRFPKLMFQVEPETDFPAPSGAAVFSLPPRALRHWQSRVLCQLRGRHQLGGFRVSISDPFGIFTWRRRFGLPQCVLVYPATRPLPFFSPLACPGSGYSPNRWLAAGVSSEAGRVRPYVAGDSLNRIHWRSTAHASQLMVKVFDPYRPAGVSRAIWVVADMDARCQLGSGQESTEEYVVTIAASVARKAVDEGIPVGLLAAADRTYRLFPDNGEKRFWEVMEALALVRANGNVPLEQLVSQEMRHFSTTSLVVVITPCASPPVVASLRLLVGRGVATVAVLLDRASFGDGSPLRPDSSLLAAGVQVHVVSRGQDLASALDSRVAMN